MHSDRYRAPSMASYHKHMYESTVQHTYLAPYIFHSALQTEEKFGRRWVLYYSALLYICLYIVCVLALYLINNMTTIQNRIQFCLEVAKFQWYFLFILNSPLPPLVNMFHSTILNNRIHILPHKSIYILCE